MRTMVLLAAALLVFSSPAFAGENIPPIKNDCAICHSSQGDGTEYALKAPLSGLCLGCHPDRVSPAEHVVDVAPPAGAGGLPLHNGLMTCVTCHDPHGKTGLEKMLRAEPDSLCRHCHEK